MIVLFLLFACLPTNEANEELPSRKNSWKFQCSSKSAGSTPACWTQYDWEVFCKRVKCIELSEDGVAGGE